MQRPAAAVTGHEVHLVPVVSDQSPVAQPQLPLATPPGRNLTGIPLPVVASVLLPVISGDRDTTSIPSPHVETLSTSSLSSESGSGLLSSKSSSM